MFNYRTLAFFSILFGILYFSGILWFGEKLLSFYKYKIILLTSPGVSLIATPIICNLSSELKFKKFAVIISICIGVIGCLYGLFISIQPSGFLIDNLVVIMQYSAIIFILVMIGFKRN